MVSKKLNFEKFEEIKDEVKIKKKPQKKEHEKNLNRSYSNVIRTPSKIKINKMEVNDRSKYKNDVMYRVPH